MSRTYRGDYGYVPIFAYLGQEGYCVNTNLRPGKDHYQNETAEFLAQSIRYARLIASLPLLVRMDAGNDSRDNLRVCLTPETRADFIIRRNLRNESPEEWLALAKKEGTATQERVARRFTGEPN